MKFKIVLHHSAIPEATSQYDRVESYHDRGAGGKWPPGHGIQYHYFIEKTGIVMYCGNEDATLWHSGNWYTNKNAIGICMAGNYVNETVPREQLKALKDLLLDIQRRRGIPNENIYLHKEIKSTACPGQDFRRLIREKLPSKTIEQKIVQVEKALKRANQSRFILLQRLLNRLLKRK